MVSGYIFPAILSSEEHSSIVYGGQVSLASFGLLALAFLIVAGENLKRNQNEWVINIGFLLSGALIVSRFQMNQYTIEWTGTRWPQYYGVIVIGFSIAVFILLSAVLGPVVYRVWRRIRRSEVYKTESRILFVGFVVLFASYGIFTIVINSIGVAISAFSASYFLFLIPIAGIAGIIARLLRLCPTIFFASSYSIIEIQFVSKATQDTMYRFLFLPENPETDSISISIAHDSIRQIFHNALDRPGEVKSTKVEANEVLGCEGKNYYGFLVTKQGSELLRRLLVKALSEFESTVGTTLLYDDEDFNKAVENYFQFAIPNIDEYDLESGGGKNGY